MSINKLYKAMRIHKGESFSNFLPSGSGFDNGSECVFISDSVMKIKTAFHHMDDNGYYCNWTDHIVTITAEFDGISVKCSGRNYRQIKDYICDVFHTTLNQDIVSIWDSENKWFTFTLGER